MRFGLRLVQHLGPARELVRLASAAEEAGFDCVWFPHDPFMKHAWVMAAAVAEHTERVQIGSVQTTPYLNEPSEAATFLATLDELSGGRAVLGYGLHTDEMVEWVGFDASDRVERIRDSVAAVRGLLRGETLRLLLNPSLVVLDALLVRIHDGGRGGWLRRRPWLRR